MKRIIAVLMAMMLVLTAFAGCSDSGKTEENDIAIKVGNTEFSVNDVNFLYIGNFNQMYSNLTSYYGEYVSTILDISKPLEEQMLDDTTSWHQYLVDYVRDSIVSNTAAYEAALADENFSIPEEMQKDLNTLEDQLKEVAESNDYTIEEYIELMYGEGMDFETIHKMTEFQYIAYAYQDQKYNSIEVSEEEMKAYYEENKNDFDTVNFRYYSSMYGDEEDSITEEEAKAQADSLAAAKTGEEFNQLVYDMVSDELKEYFKNADPTMYAGAGYASTGIEEVSEWLFDSARKQGDTMIHHDAEVKSYLTVMFEERTSADYNYIDVRHILITPMAEEGSEASEQAWIEAETRANEVLDKYLAGEMTEEAFGELAKEYSADGNAAQGGIYENVYKNQMVAEFNDWCFDPARQIGDTGIVKTRFGYHVMYFVGLGESSLNDKTRDIVAEEAFNEWMGELCSNYIPVETELFANIGGMIDDIVAAANEKAAAEAETEEETGNVTNEEVVGSEEG